MPGLPKQQPFNPMASTMIARVRTPPHLAQALARYGEFTLL